jgi:hypothetical protein
VLVKAQLHQALETAIGDVKTWGCLVNAHKTGPWCFGVATGVLPRNVESVGMPGLEGRRSGCSAERYRQGWCADLSTRQVTVPYHSHLAYTALSTARWQAWRQKSGIAPRKVVKGSGERLARVTGMSVGG